MIRREEIARPQWYQDLPNVAPVREVRSHWHPDQLHPTWWYLGLEQDMEEEIEETPYDSNPPANPRPKYRY